MLPATYNPWQAGAKWSYLRLFFWYNRREESEKDLLNQIVFDWGVTGKFSPINSQLHNWANASWAFVIKWHQNKWFCTRDWWGVVNSSIQRWSRERGGRSYHLEFQEPILATVLTATGFMFILKGPKESIQAQRSAWILRRGKPKKVETVSLKSCWFLSLISEITFIFKSHGRAEQIKGFY